MATRNIDLKVGETMKVGSLTITLLEKSGKVAKLKVVADKDVVIQHPIQQVQTYSGGGVMPLPERA